MAEKEDYIVISKKDFDYKKGHYVTHLATQMTRQEVIEKMAVGMCRFDCNDIEKECCSCNEWEKYDKLETLAEAALNAIAPMIPQEAQNE